MLVSWPSQFLDLGRNGQGVPRLSTDRAESCLPYRTGTDRRAELRVLLGQEPLFFRAQTQLQGIERRNRVHVYVDVSGSMGGELPLVYGALVPLLDYLHPEIHLFSTLVEDVSPERLRRGEVATAWGTGIDCVTAHMVDKQVRRAVILTDGWVGQVPGEHAAKLRHRRARVNSVVTRDGDPSFAAAFTGRVSRLPSLS